METKQLLANMAKNGGKILIVGGGLESYLGEAYKNHPNLIIWDDEKQDFGSKAVPGSVKAIIWNRLVSHATVIRLNNAIHQLHAIKFPMFLNRDIKSILSDVVSTSSSVDTRPIKEDNFIPLTPLNKDIDEPTPSQEENELMATKQVDKGSLSKFIAKHINLNIDYSVRGSIAKEGDRLLAKAKSEGLKTTDGSIKQAIGKMLRDMSKNKSKGSQSSPATTRVSNDDFAELDKLLADAVAAMKLIQEHLPKVRREVEKLRSSREKMLKLLE